MTRFDATFAFPIERLGQLGAQAYEKDGLAVIEWTCDAETFDDAMAQCREYYVQMVREQSWPVALSCWLGENSHPHLSHGA